jgi:WD40 repeat protein
MSSSVNSVEYTLDGLGFIAATSDGDVVQGDVSTGEIVRRFSLGAHVFKAVFSPDDQHFLACLGDEASSVVLIDYASGERVQTLTGQSRPCLALAFAPDGSSAVSGHIDGSIFHWNLSDGSLIRRFSGEQGQINDLLFSHDGQTVFSGSHPRTSVLTMWDVSTGEPYRQGQQLLTSGLDLSRDGRTLLSVSYNGSTLLSRIDTLDELIDWVAANRYIPELTCEQRDLYHVEPLCTPP